MADRDDKKIAEIYKILGVFDNQIIKLWKAVDSKRSSKETHKVHIEQNKAINMIYKEQSKLLRRVAKLERSLKKLAG